jgi:DNA mismatch endonuclease (patch repair protein)
MISKNFTFSGHNYGGICRKCGGVHTHGNLGKNFSDETKGKMSGHSYGDIPCQKCGKVHVHSRPFSGHNFGECRKCGKVHISGRGMLGKKLSVESKQRMRDGQLGKIFTNDHRRKISEFSKNMWKNPELRERARENRLHQVFPNKDTSIEVKLQNGLVDANIFFFVHYPIFGQPDLFVPSKIAIFSDGKYWHNYPDGTNRDKLVNETLTSQGYIVLRFWEHEINNNLEGCIEKILAVIKSQKNTHHIASSMSAKMIQEADQHFKNGDTVINFFDYTGKFLTDRGGI